MTPASRYGIAFSTPDSFKPNDNEDPIVDWSSLGVSGHHAKTDKAPRGDKRPARFEPPAPQCVRPTRGTKMVQQRARLARSKEHVL